MSPTAGQLVTETFEYDGGRQVTVYVPPTFPESIVFAGDGGWHISRLGEVLEAASALSAMIVGVHGLADDDARLQEYSPVFDAERFAAHEKFFVEAVRQWVQSRFGVALPAERTAVWGASIGGELALAIGFRHPYIYGAVFSTSPGGGYRPPAMMPSPLPRVYLVAGTLEPGGNQPPLDRSILRLLKRQRGGCAICADLLLHADREPHTPEEWQRWHRTTRKAITRQPIARGQGTTPDDARLIHTYCQRRATGAYSREPASSLTSTALWGLPEPDAVSAASPVLRGAGRGNASRLPDFCGRGRLIVMQAGPAARWIGPGIACRRSRNSPCLSGGLEAKRRPLALHPPTL